MSEEKQAPTEIAAETWEATPNEVKELVFSLSDHVNTLMKTVEELKVEISALKSRLN